MYSHDDNPHGTAELEFAWVEAVYEEHPNPRYKGNPLIEALERYDSDEALIEGLKVELPFCPEQRNLPKHVRSSMVSALGSMVVPLPRLVTFARNALDLMNEGYVGREPYLRAHRLRQQALYVSKKTGRPLEEVIQSLGLPSGTEHEERSTALIGASGSGKSRAIKRLLSLVSPVIKHKEHGFEQVPILAFELPDKGTSTHALATAIIEALHRRLPNKNYDDMYLRRRPKTGNALERLYDAKDLLIKHGVGLLIGDEAQKQKLVDKQKAQGKAAPKGTLEADIAPEMETPLISLLITASNILCIPLMLVGTNELHDIVEGRFSKGRRSCGRGTEYWDYLGTSGDLRNPDEFETLLIKLWKYQWVINPVKLTQHIADVLFDLTQGCPDILVKLYVDVQRYAIWEDIETITEELIRDRFKKGFKPVQRALRAKATGDASALADFPDLAPVDLRRGPGFADAAASLMRERGRHSAVSSTETVEADPLPKKRAAKRADLPSPVAAKVSVPADMSKLHEAVAGVGITAHEALVNAGIAAAHHADI